jgi:cytoskeletal protein CcmA (bactofilin family)
MAEWKDKFSIKKEPMPMSPPPAAVPDGRAEAPANLEPPRRVAERDLKESLLASGLTIEGKIEGSGHVRIAGRFKGDVHVQGDLTIEAGAKVTGAVRAVTVIIGGELDGNIEGATRVELLATGVLNGDLKAGSLTVAAGSRMRGQVEFGWEEKPAQRLGLLAEAGATA